MRAKSIPQGKYAEFIFDEANGTLNGERIGMAVYDYIDGVWLPASALELSDQPDYEVHDAAMGLITINVSVK